MIPTEHRIHVFTGHYGSGKTEVALSYAIYLKSLGRKVTVVDLDIVNPYFRTKDAEGVLNELGIKVIAPTFANTNLDLPSLPPDIYSVFFDTQSDIVFDVGGDDDGATALGRFHPYFEKEDHNMFLVVNPNRPLSATPEEIIEMLYSIEATSRLKVTYLVNNSNIMNYTVKDTVIKGAEIINEVSRKTGIEIAITAAANNIADLLGSDYPNLLRLNLYLNPYHLKD